MCYGRELKHSHTLHMLKDAHPSVNYNSPQLYPNNFRPLCINPVNVNAEC